MFFRTLHKDKSQGFEYSRNALLCHGCSIVNLNVIALIRGRLLFYSRCLSLSFLDGVGDSRGCEEEEDDDEGGGEETVFSSEYGLQSRWHNSPRDKSPEGLGAKGAGSERKVRKVISR